MGENYPYDRVHVLEAEKMTYDPLNGEQENWMHLYGMKALIILLFILIIVLFLYIILDKCAFVCLT